MLPEDGVELEVPVFKMDDWGYVATEKLDQPLCVTSLTDASGPAVNGLVDAKDVDCICIYASAKDFRHANGPRFQIRNTD